MYLLSSSTTSSPGFFRRLGRSMSRWMDGFSIRQAFLLAVIAGLGLPGILVTTLNLQWRHDELVAQYTEAHSRALEILALGLRQPMWDISPKTALPLVDSIMKDERIVEVRAETKVTGDTFVRIHKAERHRGQLNSSDRDVVYEDQVIGYVTVVFDDGSLHERLGAARREYLLMILVQLVGSVVLILLLLSSRFLQPLKLLSQQARALSEHQNEQSYTWTRQDEIGDLGRHIQQVRAELARLFGELHEKNDALEADINVRMEIEAKLRASRAKYRELFMSNLDGIFIVDLNGICMDANPAFLSMLGCELQQLVGHPFQRFIPPVWQSQDQHMLNHHVLVHGNCGEYEIELHRPGSGTFPVSAKAVLMRDEDGRATGFWRMVRDLTERKAAAMQMELAAKVFESTTEAIMVTDAHYNIVSVNPAFCEMTGFRADEVVGHSAGLLKDPGLAIEKYLHVRDNFLAEGAWQGELSLSRRSGEVFAAWIQVNVIRDVTGKVGNMVALLRDISDIKAAQERILHLARFDVLTNLPNRAYFKELVDESIAMAARHDEYCGLLFIDLDHFKTVNDSLGHAVGDALLQCVAQRLDEARRAGDIVGRLGGDEFVMLLNGVEQASDAASVAYRVLERLSQPFHVQGHELVVTPSVGVAIYPDDGGEYDTLIRNADAAMYFAKESGRNNFQFYAANMNAKAHQILAVESQLRRALERNEFVLHYQPQVEMTTGRVLGVEALIRWQHPERGLIGPGEFIPIAEERGLIGAIGNWVIKEACRQNRAWQDAGLPALEVAVNLSALQFFQKDLLDYIHDVLTESRLAPHLLALEVTESIIMQDAESTVRNMAALKSMGLKLAIDDFGTGYSSLAYLKRFKADKLKIDRSFVADLPGDQDDCTIARAIINLARNLNLQVIAEGVEEAEQWKFLLDEGCDEVQGYLVSRPLPPHELAARLASPMLPATTSNATSWVI